MAKLECLGCKRRLGPRRKEPGSKGRAPGVHDLSAFFGAALVSKRVMGPTVDNPLPYGRGSKI